MADLADLDWQIEEAALVPVPEAIVHRVLLTPRARPAWKYAAAAAVLLAALGSGWFVSQAVDPTLLAKVIPRSQRYRSSSTTVPGSRAKATPPRWTSS